MGIESLDGVMLGADTQYSDQYSPTLLFPIARSITRENLGLNEQALPFFGGDYWNAYELSWLAPSGLPQVAWAEFWLPCDSPAIIESKSFKLYLNSLNQTPMSSWDAVKITLQNDLTTAVGAPVTVKLHSLEQQPQAIVEPWRSAELLDQQVVNIGNTDPDPHLLHVSGEAEDVYLVSHLLRSLCPVTGQPDWGSVFIHYRGAAIDRAGLLKYLVGYRKHQEFHEQCVERIYRDMWQQCNPELLSVYARYVRRGGLDINPYRSSELSPIGNWRLLRQ